MHAKFNYRYVCDCLTFCNNKIMTWHTLFPEFANLIFQVLSEILSSESLNPVQLTNDSENPSSSTVDSEFIVFPQPPRLLQHNYPCNVQFRCSKSAVIGIEVLVWSGSVGSSGVIIFRHRFNCFSQPRQVQYATVRLKLPRYIAYQPGKWNPFSVDVDRAVIRAWMLDAKKFELVEPFRTFYRNATIKDEVSVDIVPAFERPARPLFKCLPWWQDFSQPVYDPKCPVDLGRGNYNI